MINLSQKERDNVKVSLESRLQQLLAIEGRLEEEALSVPYHSDDAGDLTSFQRVDITLAAAELNEINGIRRALEKLNSDSYGVCERCGKDIAPQRLKAVPAAPYCMTCETQLESKERVRKKPGDSSPSYRPLEDEQEIPY